MVLKLDEDYYIICMLCILLSSYENKICWHDTNGNDVHDMSFFFN